MLSLLCNHPVCFKNKLTDDRRKGAIMLSVLKKDLDPKVHRADISVMHQKLPPKTEFVIKVPLTDVLRKAYSRYLRFMDHLAATSEMARSLDGLAVLSLLCNHPVCFKNKLTAREEESAQVMGSQTDEETAEALAAPGDLTVTKLGLTSAMIQEQMELFGAIGDRLGDLVHSHKATIFDQILDAAIRAGDKTLVFSHSIMTLNYLENLFKATKRRYLRLTGATKMADRQKDANRFNYGAFDVYLISTRAGGLGLNLQAANRVIIFDFGLNPMWEEQAVGRAYRIGQVKPVFMYRFTVDGTFEDIIHNKAIYKLQLASRVVDKKNPMRYAQRNARDMFFEPTEVEMNELSEYRGKDPLVLDTVLEKQAA